VSHIGTQIAGNPSASGNHNCGYIAPAKSLFDDMLHSAFYKKERKTFKITALILLTIYGWCQYSKTHFFRLFISRKNRENQRLLVVNGMCFAIAPSDELVEKTTSNIQEITARPTLIRQPTHSAEKITLT
jgi:hypothetical protein